MTNSEKLLLTGLKYLGTKENPFGWDEQVKAWIFASCDSLKISRPEDDSQFAWCGCFVSNILIEAGIWPSNKLHIVAARKFLEVGHDVTRPSLGDLCILERGPGKGHIGLFINQNIDTVKLLSGNSMDSVSIADFKKSRILGYRSL